MNLLDMLSSQLGGDAVSRLSDQLGADEQTTARAVQVALPVLTAALARNANASPVEAQSLNQALEQDHDGSILDNLSGFLGHPQAAKGTGILEHVLGGKRDAVATGVSRASGLDLGKTSQLLMMLAPLLMGVLGRAKRQRNMGPGELAGTLSRSREEIEEQAPQVGSGGLSRMLDRNNDGQIVDDIVKIGGALLATGVLSQMGRRRQ